MIKLIIDDYKMNFKTGFKNIFHDGNYFIYIYLLIIPFFNFHFNGKDKIVYYVAILPLVVGLILSRLYPNFISKTLFLCPLGKGKQRQYFMTAFWLRVSIPILLFSVLNAIIFIFHMVSWYEVVLMLAILVMFLIPVNIYWDSQDWNLIIENGKCSLPKGYVGCQKAAQLIGIINMVLLVLRETDNDKFASWELVIGVLLFLQLFIFVKMITQYFKPVLGLATDYEMSYLLVAKEDKRQ